MPAISVIIPNYNHAQYLAQRIESVLNQTFDDFDVIIMDDYSQDESRTIIESYRDHPKVQQIIYNPINSGNTFFQWKKGIEMAKGEWIWIAESDDWCELTLLEELFNAAQKHENCVVSFCQSIMLEENNVIWKSNSKYLGEYLKGKDFVREHMLLGNSIFNASMCIFKKRIHENISNEFMKYKFSGDWIYWVEASLQGEVYISGKTLNYFRKHPKDISSNAFKEGLIYIEYFSVISYFEQLLLLGNQKKRLLQEKLNQFLQDKRVNKESYRRVASLFKKKLGINYYCKRALIYTKAVLNKIIELLK